MTSVWILGWLALACASISFTLTKTPIFDFVRVRLKKHPLLFELWQCPYCMGHWVALGLVLVINPRPFTGTWFDLVLSAMIITTLSILIVQLIIVVKDVMEWLRADTARRKVETQLWINQIKN